MTVQKKKSKPVKLTARHFNALANLVKHAVKSINVQEDVYDRLEEIATTQDTHRASFERFYKNHQEEIKTVEGNLREETKNAFLQTREDVEAYLFKMRNNLGESMQHVSNMQLTYFQELQDMLTLRWYDYASYGVTIALAVIGFVKVMTLLFA
jgi:hypothetical protein